MSASARAGPIRMPPSTSIPARRWRRHDSLEIDRRRPPLPAREPGGCRLLVRLAAATGRIEDVDHGVHWLPVVLAVDRSSGRVRPLPGARRDVASRRRTAGGWLGLLT